MLVASTRTRRDDERAFKHVLFMCPEQGYNIDQEMMRGVLYHTLQGSRGWSCGQFPSPCLPVVDVAKVLGMRSVTRLFMLRDYGLKYELVIRYEGSRTVVDIAPALSPTQEVGVLAKLVYTQQGLVCTQQTEECLFSRRYATIEALLQDMRDIAEKQYKLQESAKRIREEMLRGS